MRVVKRIIRGKEKYVLDFGERHGKRARWSFATETAATAALRKAQRDNDLAGRWWSTIPAKDKQEYIATLKQMRESGIHPSDVWQAYQNREFTCRERRTLREAITETIKAKREAGRDKRYVDELEKYLLKFAKDREDT